jgi:hypothetical protein
MRGFAPYTAQYKTGIETLRHFYSGFYRAVLGAIRQLAECTMPCDFFVCWIKFSADILAYFKENLSHQAEKACGSGRFDDYRTAPSIMYISPALDKYIF